MFLATTATMNQRNGNGKYRPLRRRRKQNQEEKQDNFNYLKSADPRMRFNNAKDPIYFAFEYLENRSVPELVGDFIQDSFFEIAEFVSKVVK